MALGGAEERQVGDPAEKPARRIGCHFCQQMDELAGQAFGRRRLEQVAVVEEASGETLRALRQHRREVELRPRLCQRQRFEDERAEGQPRSRRPGREGGHGVLARAPPLLQHDDRLEDRRTGRIAVRLQPLGEERERVLLVGEAGERRHPGPPQQLPERRVAREVAGDRHRIDQVAHQAGESRVGPPRRRAAHHHLLLTAVAMEQHLENGEEAHVEGGPPLPRQPAQRGDRRRLQAEVPRRAAVGLDRRPRTIGRQLQDGRVARQGLAPEVPQPLARRPGEPLRLAGREVRIIEGRCGQESCEGAGSGLLAVEHPQLPQQHPHRPEVGHDVVDREDEGLLSAPQVEEGQAEEGAVREVEGQKGHGREPPGDLRRVVGWAVSHRSHAASTSRKSSRASVPIRWHGPVGPSSKVARSAGWRATRTRAARSRAAPEMRETPRTRAAPAIT